MALIRTVKPYLINPVYQNSILVGLYMLIFEVRTLGGRGRVVSVGPFGI